MHATTLRAQAAVWFVTAALSTPAFAQKGTHKPDSSSAYGILPTAAKGHSAPSFGLDFGVTPDDVGDLNARDATELTTQYQDSLGIVFGRAVAFPGGPRPAVEICHDRACIPNSCRSAAGESFADDWWCGFVVDGQPFGVRTFSAQVAYIDNPGDNVVDIEGYDLTGVRIAAASTRSGAALQTLSLVAPPGADIAFVRVVSSADPYGLSVDGLAYSPLGPCPTTASAIAFPDPGGLNVPDSLFPLPGSATPYIGNATFAMGMDDASGACALTQGAPTCMMLSTATQNAPVQGWGCNAAGSGVVMVGGAAPVLVILPFEAWGGSGSPAVYPLPIPNEPSICGMSLYAQGAFADTTSRVISVGLTNRLDLTFGSEPTSLTNDECTDAIALRNGVTPGNNIGATTSSVTGTCGLMGSDVWYAYTASCTGMLTVSSCQGGGFVDYDTVMAAFSGTCQGLTEVLCVDDACGLASELVFSVTQGQTYYIAVGGFDGAQGNFALDVSCGTTTNNDECAGAVPITEGVTSGSTFGATTSPVSGTCAFMGSDVWYAYTASCNETATVSFCSGGGAAYFDTVVAVFTGSCATLTEIACNDDSCGLQSEVTFSATAGQTYYIAVGGYQGQQGTFDMSVTCSAPPANDDCVNAIAIGEGLTAGSTIGATTSMVTGLCGSMGNDVWYAYTPTCTGTATASFCDGGSANYDTVLAAFSGTCETLVRSGCNDDFCSLLSEISFPVTAGQTYFLAVGGYEGATGNFSLFVSCSPN